MLLTDNYYSPVKAEEKYTEYVHISRFFLILVPCQLTVSHCFNMLAITITRLLTLITMLHQNSQIL
jgi:hypothetical protein